MDPNILFTLLGMGVFAAGCAVEFAVKISRRIRQKNPEKTAKIVIDKNRSHGLL